MKKMRIKFINFYIHLKLLLLDYQNCVAIKKMFLKV